MRTTGLLAIPSLLLLSLLPVMPVAAADAPAVELTAEPSHHLALDNDHVRVFKVEVAPHASTLLHRHGHDYYFVSIGDAHVSNEVQGKPPAELKLADGEVKFAAGDFAHVARNLSGQPFRNVTVELMQDAKARQEPPAGLKEGEERKFPGGWIKALFVRGGARVSEVELQPGAMVPSHHHDGPHLVVAVSDLELSSDVEGRGPMPVRLKSGDVKWVPGGFTHTLTNTASTPAKLVTVEFP